jgi:hypothetical protein
LADQHVMHAGENPLQVWSAVARITRLYVHGRWLRLIIPNNNKDADHAQIRH